MTLENEEAHYRLAKIANGKRCTRSQVMAVLIMGISMGNLSLVTSFYNFCVVKAESELEVAADMLAHPWRWLEFLERSYLIREIGEERVFLGDGSGLCLRGDYDSIKQYGSVKAQTVVN